MIAGCLLVEFLQRHPALLEGVFLVGPDVGKVEYLDGIRDTVALVEGSFLFFIINLHLLGLWEQVTQWFIVGQILLILQHDLSWKGVDG